MSETLEDVVEVKPCLILVFGTNRAENACEIARICGFGDEFADVLTARV